MEQTKGKLIHVGIIYPKGRKPTYLFLRQLSPDHYAWFQEESPRNERETSVSAPSIAEALQRARQTWSLDSFRTLICGFRYGLPERDEHGTNALFHQMAASYSSMNGVYFDPDLGYNCIVSFASNEAKQLWQRLQQSGQL
jgi:hypothetical protein